MKNQEFLEANIEINIDEYIDFIDYYILNWHYFTQTLNYAIKVTKDEKIQMELDDVLYIKEDMDENEKKIKEEWRILKKDLEKYKYIFSKECNEREKEIFSEIYLKILSLIELFYLSFVDFRELYETVSTIFIDPDTRENALKLEENISNNIRFEFREIQDNHLRAKVEFYGLEYALKERIMIVEEVIIRINEIFNLESRNKLADTISTIGVYINMLAYEVLFLHMECYRLKYFI